jgi:hypothetical protein
MITGQPGGNFRVLARGHHGLRTCIRFPADLTGHVNHCSMMMDMRWYIVMQIKLEPCCDGSQSSYVREFVTSEKLISPDC